MMHLAAFMGGQGALRSTEVMRILLQHAQVHLGVETRLVLTAMHVYLFRSFTQDSGTWTARSMFVDGERARCYTAADRCGRHLR